MPSGASAESYRWTMRIIEAVVELLLVDHDEPRPTGAADGPVQGVIAATCQQDVLDVHRAAEKLHAVVFIVLHLHVTDGGAAADALEGSWVSSPPCARW